MGDTELNDILRELCIGDFLEQILTAKEDNDQISCLRKLRNKIQHYPQLYNVYCAAKVLVEDPIGYIKTKIINLIYELETHIIKN